MRLYSIFHTDDESIELAQAFLLEMGLEGEVIGVLEDSLN
jgi:hypothetical protein